METQSFNVRYIVVHVIPLCDWRVLNYADKMIYHYLVTATGRLFTINALQPADGCIEIAYVGSEIYAQQSSALFSLLLDVSVMHPVACIVDSRELYQSTRYGIFANIENWLHDRLPDQVQLFLLKCSNLLMLRHMFPNN